MSQMADVPDVLSLLSFSTPALSSTITTLLSSSILSMATAILSAYITSLTSSRVLFPSPVANSNWLLTSPYIDTWTQCTVAKSWRRPFWGAILLSDLPCWVTLTTTGDSRHTLLPSPLKWLGELHLCDLTYGTPLLLTGNLLGDLALLGDVPHQPDNCTMGSSHGAFPGDLLMGPPLGDLPLQPADSLCPVSLLAVLPMTARLSFHGACPIFPAGTDLLDSCFHSFHLEYFDTYNH